MVIALANKLSECWIASQPALIGAYVFDWFNYYFFLFFKRFNIASIIEKRYFKKPPSNPA